MNPLATHREEILRLLEADAKFLGEVHRLAASGLTAGEIAQKLGHKNPRSVTIFLHARDMLLGEEPLTRELYKSHDQSLYAIHRWLPLALSEELRAVFVAIERGQEPAAPPQHESSSEEPPRVPLQPASAPPPTEALEGPASAVYVYSYPLYIASPISPENGDTLYKIGASRHLERRVAQQRRKTEVPEDLVLLRTYPTPYPFELEKKLHATLRLFGEHHRSTEGGVEWFLTNLQRIDGLVPLLSIPLAPPSPFATQARP